MVSKHAQQLACELITSHFGDLVGKAFRVEQEGGGPASAKVLTQYAVLVDNIFHRMRFSKFLGLLREDLGEECESLLEGLLEHGRLTLEQIIQRAAARSGKGETEIQDPLKETFAALIHGHYIERCPAPEPLLLPRSLDDAPKKVQRGSSRGRATIDVEQMQTEEQRITAVAAPSEGERFLLPSFFQHAKPTERGNGDATLSNKVGDKRKYECLNTDTETVAMIDEKEVLWRANYEEFVRRLRFKACVSLVRSRLDLGAGTILEAMLEATRSSASSAKQKISAPLSMDAIMQAVRATTEGRTMTMERIRASLNQMASDSIRFLTRVGDMGGQYVINLYKIIEVARKNEVEAIVLKRFGRESCRIFRLLAMKGQLEQKQISDQALVGRKETLELLYKLLKEDYLQLQEIAKSLDHAPSKTFYLWRVNSSSLMEHIIDDMYHAASNFGQRLAHELEQEQEVLELLKKIHQSKNTDGSAAHVTLTNSQCEQVNRIRRVATVLETSLLKLDDSIMLFHDF